MQQSGYTGGRVLVSNLVAQFRTPETKYFRKVAPPKKPKLAQLLSAPRQLASMLVRRPENLSAQDQHKLRRIEAVNPIVSDLRRLVQDFSRLMRDRNAAGLGRWQETAIGSSIPAISQFAKGIERDRAAVDAAFTLPWSSGQVEGQVHRLKLIKRQMYCRAGFQLLRTRLLPFPPTQVQHSP